MEYLWLVLLVLAVSGQNILVGCFNKKVKQSTPCVLTLFFSVITLLGFVFVALANKTGLFSQGFNTATVVCGLVGGLVCSLHFVFIQLAMKTGSVSLTSLFVSYSLLIPTIFSIFYNHDTVDVCFFIGLPLLIASIALTNVKKIKKQAKTIDTAKTAAETKPADGKEKITKKVTFWWILFVLLAVVTNGSFAICQQIQQKHAPDIAGKYQPEFTILAMSVVVIFNLIFMFSRKKDREAIMPSFKGGWHFALSNGIVYFIILHMQLMLTKAAAGTNPKLAMSVVNPVLGAGSLVITLVASIFIFKEKLNYIQWIGVGLGVLAIVLLNLHVYPVIKWNNNDNIATLKDSLMYEVNKWKY